jgi:hypothetical protein
MKLAGFPAWHEWGGFLLAVLVALWAIHTIENLGGTGLGFISQIEAGLTKAA